MTHVSHKYRSDLYCRNDDQCSPMQQHLTNFENTQGAHVMNELLTRELTNDELSLISGGGESDQNGFGLREIYDYWERQWERQDFSMRALDHNGDGDGWDEISYTYGALAAATGVVTVNLAATANPAAVPVGMAGALLTVAMVAASGIDTYRYGPNLR